MPTDQDEGAYPDGHYRPSSSEIKSFFYFGIPIWLSALAMLLFTQQIAQYLISFFFVLGTILSFIILVLRPWLFKRLVMPHKLDDQLIEECRQSFENKVKDSGKIVPDIKKATTRIKNRVNEYFDEVFRQIEIEFRNGRASNLIHNWNLFIGTLMSCLALILILCIYVLAYFELITGLNSSNPMILSIGVVLLTFFVALFIFLIRISFYEFKHSIIVYFPLLLTTPQFKSITDFSETAQAIQASNHPKTFPSSALAQLNDTRNKGIDQRRAIVEGISEQTSIDLSLVDDYLTYVFKIVFEMILYRLIDAVYFLIMESYLRISALIRLSTGLSMLAIGLLYSNSILIFISIFMIGSGVGTLFRLYWTSKKRKSLLLFNE